MPCIQEVASSYWTNFLKGCALKLFIRLLTERSAFFRSASFSHYRSIINLGVVAGLFSGLFKASRCFLNKFCPSWDPLLKSFIAGIVCSLSLQLASSGEQSLIKLFLYPRILESLFHFISDEKGWVKKFTHGDILAYAFQAAVICYNYYFEPDNFARSFNRTIDSYSNKDFEIERAMFCTGFKLRADINKRYGTKTCY